MKTLIVNEIEGFPIAAEPSFDLCTTTVKDCLGCWSCWWTTPGRCVHKDLDDFYKKYLAADQVLFFAKLNRGFVSGNMKTLFDRMIPHFLPYCVFENGGTRHSPRYKKYPNIAFYYDGEFEEEEDRVLFTAYIQKVFDQFYSPRIHIAPLSSYVASEESAV